MQIINKVQDAILKDFGSVPDSQYFYLVGGTALARFYLQHRQSNDLDFFTGQEEIIVPFSQQLELYLKSKNFGCTRQRVFHSFVELVVTLKEESTLIHLALDAAFRFSPTIEFPDYPKLKVDNLKDIASNKLLALFGRATLRDFIDVYFLIQRKHFSKQELMEAAGCKDPGFDLYWLGVSFERIHAFNAEAPDMLLLIESVKLSELQTFFDGWRAEIGKGLRS